MLKTARISGPPPVLPGPGATRSNDLAAPRPTKTRLYFPITIDMPTERGAVSRKPNWA